MLVEWLAHCWSGFAPLNCRFLQAGEFADDDEYAVIEGWVALEREGSKHISVWNVKTLDYLESLCVETSDARPLDYKTSPYASCNCSQFRWLMSSLGSQPNAATLASVARHCATMSTDHCVLALHCQAIVAKRVWSSLNIEWDVAFV